mmetsp:Transcript_3266/g.10897  ORF Transcript_3266/g.10897 Transcript_3266/m.10897 type:complete len:111 (+) Transcript_3266:375-707(+)
MAFSAVEPACMASSMLWKPHGIQHLRYSAWFLGESQCLSELLERACCAQLPYLQRTQCVGSRLSAALQTSRLQSSVFALSAPVRREPGVEASRDGGWQLAWRISVAAAGE